MHKLQTKAPTARNMKARGKREAKRSASPLDQLHKMRRSPERAKYRPPYFALSGLDALFILLPGATRFALAPGFHISRRWRSGLRRASLRACPWLSYSAPLALRGGT